MDLEERVSPRKLASLPYWWEKTCVLDIPQPKTVYVPYEGHTLRRSLDGEKLDITPLLKAADMVGGYPVFGNYIQKSCQTFLCCRWYYYHLGFVGWPAFLGMPS